MQRGKIFFVSVSLFMKTMTIFLGFGSSLRILKELLSRFVIHLQHNKNNKLSVFFATTETLTVGQILSLERTIILISRFIFSHSSV